MRYGIALCGLREVAGLCAAWHPTHALSLVAPDPLAPLAALGRERRLVVPVADVESADAPGVPRREDMERVLGFGRGLPDGARLLIHCEAGVSRSGAAALALLAQEMGRTRIEQAGRLLSELRPSAHPNALMTAQADGILGFGGALLAALPAIRERADAHFVAMLG